jgi:hypothetical protein
MNKDEWLNDPRPCCTWCGEPKEDVKERLDPFFVEGIYKLGKNTMLTCYACWHERRMDV